jgi:hypothetical protein
MANTPPNNTPPNSKKIALDAARERREQVLSDLERLEVEKKQEVVTANKAKIQREINKLIKEEDSLRQRIALFGEKEEKLQKSVADSLADQISSLKIKKNLSDKLSDAEDLQLRITERIQSKLERGVITYEEAEDAVKKLNRSIRERLSIEEKTKKVLDASKESANAFLNDVSKGIKKIPVVGESLSAGFDTFIKSNAGKKVRDKLAERMFDPEAIGKSLKGALGLGMIAAGTGLISKGIGITLATEQEQKDQQRSIGLTNEQSKAVDRMQRGLLMSSSSMVTNLEEARKASAELVEDFGTFGATNNMIVDQQVKLTKAFGLTGEEASNFQRTSTIIGRTTEDSKLAVFATAAGFNKLTGSTQSLSGILRTVSKLSDSIRIQFRGSDEELTNAVMKAKALGTSLEDLNGIADQLLNIESSIENQVTAQLVTGRNINLEKARFFALTDDMNGLMDELVKQEIDYTSYSKMNRVEKQATAAALGMNVDQMAKFVSQQELAKQLNIDMSKAENQTSAGLAESLKMHQATIEARAKLGDAAAKQYMRDNEALTTQEKMNKLVEQMSKGFALMGPVLIGFGAAIVIIGIGLLKAAIAAAALTTAVSGGLAGFSIAAGVAVAAGAIFGVYKGAQMVNDGIAPSSNGPFTITDRYGATAVTANGDGLAVSPNINTSSNNKETNDLLRQILAKVDQPAIIKMGDTTINELGNKINLNRNYQADARTS